MFSNGIIRHNKYEFLNFVNIDIGGLPFVFIFKRDAFMHYNIDT